MATTLCNKSNEVYVRERNIGELHYLYLGKKSDHGRQYPNPPRRKETEMKKIPKSITVTVRNGEDFRATRLGRTYLGHGMDRERIRNAFGRCPAFPYKVTYTLNPRGKYLVDKKYDNARLLLVTDHKNLSGGYYETWVCFLNDLDWDGLRISRKVEKIK